MSLFSKNTKRIVDLFFCIFCAIPVIILSLCIAIAIYKDHSGPIFFRHKRLGKYGKPISIIKFRTMYYTRKNDNKCILSENHLKEYENDYKIRRDPRITHLGAFLRKYSLDELPQFINIFLGDMSLVGPRPIVSEEKEKYGNVFNEYCQVRPGLTGLWQVSGRNDISYEERVALDHYYITHWSLRLDFWILLRTIPAVLSAKGAY